MSQVVLTTFFNVDVARQHQSHRDRSRGDVLAFTREGEDASGLRDGHVDTFSVLQSVMSQLPFP